MAYSRKKSTLKLPTLKTRDELLKATPQLARFLGDDSDTSTVPRVQPAFKARPLSGKPSGDRGSAAFAFDEITEEDKLRMELERVKAERASLLESLAKLHKDQGKSGGDLQQEDIRLLRREIEAKKEKLNELRKATKQDVEMLEQLETTSRDCEQLMPQGLEAHRLRMQQLTEELSAVEADIIEAEANNELYKLLEIRTRRDHQAAQTAMREAREMKDDASDDVSTLTKAMYEMRAAKEGAEQQLGMVVAMFDQVRSDWKAKLQDRRKEVRELEKRKLADSERQEQEAAINAEKDRISRDKGMRQQQEQEAQEASLSAVAPQLATLEATWARLHALTAANSCEDVIAHWQELRTKGTNMQELVRLAEVREARAKEEMSSLLDVQMVVFDRNSKQTQPTAADGADAPTTAPIDGDMEGSSKLLEEKAQQIANAKRRKQTAKKNFSRLSQVCIAAEQGLQLLLERLKAAMSRSAAPSDDGAAAIGLPTDRRRSSAAAAYVKRPSSVKRNSVAGVRRISAVGFIESRQSHPHTVLLEAGVAGDIATRVPAGSNINDKEFFPDLPVLVADVGEQLTKMLALAEQMEAANAMQREVGDAAEPGSASASEECGSPTRKLQWADRHGTPRVDEAGEDSDDGEERAQEEELAQQVAQGEKQLRGGFRRRTWAGPAWVDTITGKAPNTALLSKKAAAASGSQLHRVVGHAQEPHDVHQRSAFAFDSPEVSDDDQVVDRHYLKHRARKLTNQRGGKAKGGNHGPAS